LGSLDWLAFWWGVRARSIGKLPERKIRARPGRENSNGGHHMMTAVAEARRIS
jgi:hypothetical protein